LQLWPWWRHAYTDRPVPSKAKAYAAVAASAGRCERRHLQPCRADSAGLSKRACVQRGLGPGSRRCRQGRADGMHATGAFQLLLLRQCVAGRDRVMREKSADQLDRPRSRANRAAFACISLRWRGGSANHACQAFVHAASDARVRVQTCRQLYARHLGRRGSQRSRWQRKATASHAFTPHSAVCFLAFLLLVFLLEASSRGM